MSNFVLMSNPCLAYDNKRIGIIIFQNKIDYILWTKKHRKWETIFVGMMLSVTIYSGSVLTSSHVMTPISIEIRSYQIFYLILLNFLTICFKRNFRYGILVWELTIEIIRVNKENTKKEGTQVISSSLKQIFLTSSMSCDRNCATATW